MNEDPSTLPDLASRSLGAAVVYANDELFADRANLIMPGPVKRSDDFGHRGKIYDGWETRRRRSVEELGAGPTDADCDQAVIRLGAAGTIASVVVDTTFFRGNYPPYVSIEATSMEGYPSVEELLAVPWETLLDRAPALGDHENRYDIEDPRRWTHVRLSIHPDGGVARLRVHGRVIPDPRRLVGTVDLAAIENGGWIEDCSNMFYSSPSNVLLPGLAANMGDGWETARRRGTGNDWLAIRLAAAGIPREIEIDTSYFVGNAPAAVTVTGRAGSGPWHTVLDKIRLQPDTRHRLRPEKSAEIDQLRVDVFPDGGLARVRVLGELSPTAVRDAFEHWWRLLPAWHRQYLGVRDGFAADGPDLDAVAAALGV
jgi:allantoicase